MLFTTLGKLMLDATKHVLIILSPDVLSTVYMSALSPP
jgi:hypothetical protein